jgi:hypothetical protein
MGILDRSLFVNAGYNYLSQTKENVQPPPRGRSLPAWAAGAKP